MNRSAPRQSPPRKPPHRERLPIDDVLPEVVGQLTERPNLVLRAATGAGKTTRVPPQLAVAGWDRVLMLEPRRVAARAAARRMAEENGWRLGHEVGYQVRFDRNFRDSSRIVVVTEGILVQMLQRDPFLDGVGALIFDELHERHLASDVALAMARKIQLEARPDLRLIAMSATLDAQPVIEFLGGASQCASVESRGRLYPVEVSYLERPDARGLPVLVREAVLRLLPETPGDLLVFLPGVGEIHRCSDFLESVAKQHDLAVLPLYGDLPADRQDAVLRRGARRKVVLATNVAESSVTLDGVTAVIDSGQARTLRYETGLGLDRLVLGRISAASAEQRAGRAGRQQPGVCLRLWTEHDQRSLPERERPEIHRVDLSAAALELLVWGETDLGNFGWLDAPKEASLSRALEVLEDLGAIQEGRPTPLGHDLARLGLPPRLARLLVAGHDQGWLYESAVAAAMLSERDVVFRPVGQRPVRAAMMVASDVVDRIEGVLALDKSGFGETALGPIDRGRARHVLRLARQLESTVKRRLKSSARTGAEGGSSEGMGMGQALRRAIFLAFPDRVARRREPGGRRCVMVGGRGARLAEMSGVTSAELLVAVEIDAGRGSEALIRQASSVDPEWLELSRETVVIFDPERQRAIGKRQDRYRDLVIHESEVDPGPDLAAHALAVAAANDPCSSLALDRPSVALLMGRMRFLTTHMPNLDLPSLDEAYWRELMPALAAGRRSFADLQSAPLLEIIRGTLSHAQNLALDRHAPESILVPSGSHIRLAYDDSKPPVLAVRIQELFGQAETPTVAGGSQRVLLHLLAPNMRPQQVTQDLSSFWANTYPLVRKELAGRYPKHAWPEDPLAAEPMRGAKRRRQ